MHHRVFIYGTLKKDCANARFNLGTQLTGHYSTLCPYPLYRVGQRYMPWLMNQPGQGQQVVGEVFQVTQPQLALMDQLERISHADGYQRMAIKIKAQVSSRIFTAWAYLKPRQQLKQQWIRMGPLKVFDERHNELYKPKKR